MKELIGWLKDIEHLASVAYRQAAALHAEDAEFSAFLARIANDEAWHCQVMGNAADFLASGEEHLPAIAVDVATSEQIKGYFEEMQQGWINKPFPSKG